MQFLFEFLSHFTASEILTMYKERSFRTCEQIKVADLAINCKIIFENDHFSCEEMEAYNHLQKVVDAIRAYQLENPSNFSTEEFHRYFSSETVRFKHFVKFNEVDKEVTDFNVFERRIAFAFNPMEECACNALTWLKEALEELLSYVLRDAGEDDRVGLVINYVEPTGKGTTFSIKIRDHLKSSIVPDTFTAFVNLKQPLVTGEKMRLQVIRICMPEFYRSFTTDDVVRLSGIIL